MEHGELIKVLLVEDDEDDYTLTRGLLSDIRSVRFTLEWVKTYDEGLEKLLLNQSDICLVDYRLGAHNGIELLRTGVARGCQMPIILLTGLGEHALDVEAMQAGAADYLVKAQLRADSLERSLRYALQRKRAAALAAFDQARLAAFGAEVGQAVAGRDPLDVLLNRCAMAMTQYLNADLAQIAIFDTDKRQMISRAIAGPLTEGFQSPAEAPVARLNLEAPATFKPLILSRIADDPAIVDQAWLKAHEVCAGAFYPLVLEDKLVGLLSLYSRQPLAEQILQDLGSVACGVALCIQRKQSQEALDRSEVKYRTVVESIKEVIFQLDAFGNWVMLNPAWTAVTGFEVETTLKTFFLDYIYQEDKERNRLIFLQLMERKLAYCRHETRLYTKSGQVRWAEIYLQTLVDEHDNVMGVSGSLSDINDRKAAEIQIQKLAAFPQVNPNPVLEFTADGKVSYVNQAARELATRLGQQEVRAILPAEAGQMAEACLASRQPRLREEVRVGNHILTWSFFPVVSSQVVHCYGADVTEMLNLEAQLRHAQKLESVGQLAAGVAHDFNNILTVIQGYSETLLSRNPEDPFTATALKQISLASQRAAGLTRQLLTFSRKQVIQPRQLDLNVVVKNLVNLISRLVGEDIRLETCCEADLPSIEADTGMVEQVLMNLAVNSRDAMPNGGTLRIATTTEDIDGKRAGQHADARPGAFVCLAVTDTGCGMDAKTLERIFEPFFTTKPVGKGTGLGLATVYGIVKQHHGWLEVESQPGRGTAFKIYFPATAAPADLGGVAILDKDETSFGRRETVFLVEDDPVLREFVRNVLVQYQYRVLEAASGAEALRLWDEMDGSVDLLLTDMVMPDGVSGWELATNLRKRHADLKIVFSSGYSEEIVGKKCDLDRVWFLPKPYNPHQLVQVVRRCLDASTVSINPAVAGGARKTAGATAVEREIPVA